MNQINLTNQELISELKKRVQNGTLKVQTTAEQFEKETKPLFSYLDSKDLLLLVGLAAGFTLLVCYITQVTSSSVTGVNLKLSDGQVK